MKGAAEEPKCGNATAHSWQELGVNDAGETVERCGNCLERRYTKDGSVRYDEAPKPAAEG